MPNYFFECSKKHIFEAIVSYEKMLKGITCKYKDKDYPSSKCKAKAKRLFLSPSQAQNARHFSPTLLYMREDGELVVPGRNDLEQLPKSYRSSLLRKGYKEVQISNFREYEKFQRDISEKLKSRADSYNHAEQSIYNQAIKQEIDSLKRGGEFEFPNENGKGTRIVKVPPLSEMHPKARRFAEYAIQRALEHKFKSNSANPQINAFENDNVHYIDKDTDFKRRY